MDSLPNLSLSPPTPSPATPTATASPTHHRLLSSPQNPARKKRTKAFYFQLQPTSTASSSTSPAKPKPSARKPDPSAPKITMPCSECGKKFWSWKALYGHMRCHPNRQWRGINPPPHIRRPTETILMSPEDHEAASCLLLLANCYSPGELELESAGDRAVRDAGGYSGEAAAVVGLGHTCGICLKVFSSGQALGGHKRCHWEKNNYGGSSSGGAELPVSSPGGVGGGLDLNLPPSQLEEMQLVLRLGF